MSKYFTGPSSTLEIGHRMKWSVLPYLEGSWI